MKERDHKMTTFTEEQLNERKNSLGGSDAAAAMGISPWKTPLTLWLEKRGEIPLADLSDNDAVLFGTLAEDAVAKMVEIRTGWKLRRNNRTLKHPEYSWMTAHLDREIVGEDTIVEIKTASSYASGDWENDEVPLHYTAQLVHYLAVTGKSKAVICCMVGNSKLVIKTILRDESAINTLIEAEKRFWEMVQTGTRPAVTAQDTGILKTLFPQSVEKKTVVMPPHAEELMAKIKGCDEAIDSWETSRELYVNQIKEFMQDCEAGIVGSYDVSWKSQVAEKLDTKKLKKELPEVFLKYVMEVKSRPFKYKKVTRG